MVMGLGRPAAWVVLVEHWIIALFLIYEYTPLRVFDVRKFATAHYFAASAQPASDV